MWILAFLEIIWYSDVLKTQEHLKGIKQEKIFIWTIYKIHTFTDFWCDFKNLYCTGFLSYGNWVNGVLILSFRKLELKMVLLNCFKYANICRQPGNTIQFFLSFFLWFKKYMRFEKRKTVIYRLIDILCNEIRLINQVWIMICFWLKNSSNRNADLFQNRK